MVKTLVFIHGWASGPQIWQAQKEYFSKKYEVILPDIAGVKDIEKAAGLIDAEIKDRKNFVLIGWSLGWLAILELLKNFLIKPKGLIAVNSTAKFIDDGYLQAGPTLIHLLKMMRDCRRNPQKTLDNFYKSILSEAGKSMLTGIRFKNLDYDNLIYGLYMLRDCDYRDFIANIEIPTLIISGLKDKICPPEASEYARKKISGSRLKVFDCGHLPFLDKTAEFNFAIDDFIKKLK